MEIKKGASFLLFSNVTFNSDVCLMARQLFLSAKHYDIGGILFGIGMASINSYKSLLYGGIVIRPGR